MPRLGPSGCMGDLEHESLTSSPKTHKTLMVYCSQPPNARTNTPFSRSKLFATSRRCEFVPRHFLYDFIYQALHNLPLSPVFLPASVIHSPPLPNLFIQSPRSSIVKLLPQPAQEQPSPYLALLPPQHLLPFHPFCQHSALVSL